MNKQISVLIADENREFAKKLMSEIENKEFIENIDFSIGGEETLSKVLTQKPDVLVLDVMLSGVDGYVVIEEVKKQLPETKILVLSSLSSDTFVQKAMSLGVEYYMVKPASCDVIYKRMIEMFETYTYAVPEINNSVSYESVKQGKNKQMEEKITNIFITVGIPAHIKGYHFLREAIKMAIETPEIVNSITKKLYPSIAERFETSASKVERAIRHAIEVAWNRGKIENINTLFGVKVYSNNEKPTNGEFIALLADKMLIEG